MGLLGFHLGAPNAPGESEADVAAFGGRFADGGVIGVEAAATGADGAEHISHIEEQRQATVDIQLYRNKVTVPTAFCIIFGRSLRLYRNIQVYVA